MIEEIIIKTETVKISELQGREKQIYDAGVSNGTEISEPPSQITRLLAVFGFLSLLVFLAIFLHKLTTLP